MTSAARLGLVILAWFCLIGAGPVGVVSVADHLPEGWIEGVTDSSRAFQAAIDRGHAAGRAVYVPSGMYRVDAPLRMTGNYNVLFGDGMTSRIFTTRPITILTVDAGTSGGAFFTRVRDLQFFAEVDGATAIELTGSGSSFHGHGAYTDLAFQGFDTAILSSKTFSGLVPGQGSPWGIDNHLDWNLFANIRILSNGPRLAIWGFRWWTGTGTGNVISNVQIHTQAQGMSFAGWDGCNVGDLTIIGAQMSQGTTGAGVCMYFDGGSPYRQRIVIIGGQCDGGIGGTAIVMNGYRDVSIVGFQPAGGMGVSLELSNSAIIGVSETVAVTVRGTVQVFP